MENRVTFYNMWKQTSPAVFFFGMQVN